MSLNNVVWRPPRLETPRVLLRGWEPSDAEDVFRYASDPDVARYMAWDQHTSLEASRQFLHESVAQAYCGEELTYALCLVASPSAVVGGMEVSWQSHTHAVMELGYVLAQQHWGNGYVVEAAKALIAFAFATTNVERIYAPIFSVNTKSRRAAEKIGMTLDGVLRSAVCFRGQRRDEAIYSVLRSDAAALTPHGSAQVGRGPSRVRGAP